MDQPYVYRRRELVEPDWRRFPGFAEVSVSQWRSAQWQRAHCAKSVAQLRDILGTRVADSFYADLVADQERSATMSMLVPPQMLNTMCPHDEGRGLLDLHADPVRRYMLPVASDRRADWPSHPLASRDSLHEVQMWAVEGLTHRYPTKVLAELLATCPQYCGHCTRMDLVGNSTPQVAKLRFAARPAARYAAMLEYLRATPVIRDVVVSGGDVANLPWHTLEDFVRELLDIDSIRDIRLASKALAGLPQHWLGEEVRAGLARLGARANARGVSLALHTHVNHVNSLTPLVAEAARAVREAGLRDVRNQGVLLRGVNDSAAALLDLSFALLDSAAITPYYFYTCDMIPGSEHWRLPIWRAQELQAAIMGYLPGFATPRVVADVPFVGKRWVHQCVDYDRVHGISWWTKNYRTALESADEDALSRRFPYYDPVDSLPPEGRAWWAARAGGQPGAPVRTVTAPV